MTDPDELGRLLSDLAAAFETLGTVWAVGGSVASSAYGEPRATNDVDVIAALDETSARKLPELLGASFYLDADAAVDAVRRRSSFNGVDTRSFIKVDVFVPGPGPLGLGQLERRHLLATFPGTRALPILAPEDIVLQKLNWYRLGGGTSSQQWRDLVAVIRAEALDDAYLDRVAVRVGLEELLARARAEV